MVKAIDMQTLSDQVIELQSQFAFQEDVISALNDVVTRQQQQIENLKEMLANYKSQVEHMQAEIGSQPPVEKPPHY